VPRRSLSQSSFFDPEVVMPECLERGTAPWLLARYRRALFPLWLFARKVARARLISLTDPQARHGRKSKSSVFNGFKLHVLGDSVGGLIAAGAGAEDPIDYGACEFAAAPVDHTQP